MRDWINGITLGTQPTGTSMPTTITISDALPAGTYTLTAGTNPNPIPPIPPEPIPPQPIPPGTVTIPWGPWPAWYSIQHGGFACQQTLIFVLDVPLDAKPGAYPNVLTIAEFQSVATSRQMVLSKTPGSFDYATAITASQGTTVTIMVQVGPNGNVQAGDRLYFNVRNWSTDLDPSPPGNFSCTPGMNVNIKAEWTFYPS